MLTLCSVSASNVYHDKVHLSVLVPVHSSYAIRRGAGGEFKMRAKSAIAIVDKNGNSVGRKIDRSQIRDMVAIEIGGNELRWFRTDRITLS